MTQNLLLLALVYLDRMTDTDCGELEHYELDCEIEQLRIHLTPADDAYFQAVLDIVNFAQRNN